MTLNSVQLYWWALLYFKQKFARTEKKEMKNQSAAKVFRFIIINLIEALLNWEKIVQCV